MGYVPGELVFGSVQYGYILIGDTQAMARKTARRHNAPADVVDLEGGCASEGQDAPQEVRAGVLGVVQHRAGPETDTSKFTGYVPEQTVIALAEGAGFVLDAKSEINANPDDRANYEGGVWTLPPSLRLGETDREKYLAIGESDRMTLRFRKP